MNWVSLYQNVFNVDFTGAGLMEVVVMTGCIGHAKLRSNRPHQHLTIYRPYALPVTRATVSEHWKDMLSRVRRQNKLSQSYNYLPFPPHSCVCSPKFHHHHRRNFPIPAITLSSYYIGKQGQKPPQSTIKKKYKAETTYSVYNIHIAH